MLLQMGLFQNKASRKSIRKNSNDISLKALRLTLNNLCLRDILERLSQLRNNNSYIAKIKTQVTKDCSKSAVKILQQTRTKIFLNLFCWFEQFIAKVVVVVVVFENLTTWKQQ